MPEGDAAVVQNLKANSVVRERCWPKSLGESTTSHVSGYHHP